MEKKKKKSLQNKFNSFNLIQLHVGDYSLSFVFVFGDPFFSFLEGCDIHISFHMDL